jgi:hypothetical protein
MKSEPEQKKTHFFFEASDLKLHLKTGKLRKR